MNQEAETARLMCEYVATICRTHLFIARDNMDSPRRARAIELAEINLASVYRAILCLHRGDTLEAHVELANVEFTAYYRAVPAYVLRRYTKWEDRAVPEAVNHVSLAALGEL
jgi:hypothetical protein